METENSNIQNAKELVERLQLLGMILGPQKYYSQFLASNAGLVTSLGDLIDKIDNGTATKNDYIDVIKDIAAIGVSTTGLLALATGGTLSLGITIGIGVGLAALDYADEHNYDPTEIKDDLSQKLDTLNNMLKESSDWLDSSLDDMSSDINDLFNDSKSTDSSHISPLVLDLDGTGWVKSNGGILVLDRNGNNKKANNQNFKNTRKVA